MLIRALLALAFLCVLQPSELFKLVHSFVKDLEQALWEVAAAERAAARSGQKCATPVLCSPSPSCTQLGEPADQEAKDTVINEMKAFWKMSPADRRSKLHARGSCHGSPAALHSSPCRADEYSSEGLGRNSRTTAVCNVSALDCANMSLSQALLLQALLLHRPYY